MQFKIDENLPDALVALLAEQGHEASTVRHESLNGRPDVEVAAVCRSERRVLITLDLDFSDITAFPPEKLRRHHRSSSPESIQTAHHVRLPIGIAATRD